MPKKCYIENEGNATLSMVDIYYYSINNPLFLTNILFGNYRLPIKIYYICFCTVDSNSIEKPTSTTIEGSDVGFLFCICFSLKQGQKGDDAHIKLILHGLLPPFFRS